MSTLAKCDASIRRRSQSCCRSLRKSIGDNTMAWDVLTNDPMFRNWKFLYSCILCQLRQGCNASINYVHVYKRYYMQDNSKSISIWPLIEPQRQKTGLRGFRPGLTQIRLRSLWKWLEAWNLVFRKKRDCTIRVAKTKTLISFAVTAKLICVFVFAYAKIRFSHVAAQLFTVKYLSCRYKCNCNVWWNFIDGSSRY